MSGIILFLFVNNHAIKEQHEMLSGALQVLLIPNIALYINV